MTQRTTFQFIVTFDIVVNMDDDSTKQDVINENKYVLDEAQKIFDDLAGFQAGCGTIDTVHSILNK